MIKSLYSSKRSSGNSSGYENTASQIQLLALVILPPNIVKRHKSYTNLCLQLNFYKSFFALIYSSILATISTALSYCSSASCFETMKKSSNLLTLLCNITIIWKCLLIFHIFIIGNNRWRNNNVIFQPQFC